MMFGVHAGIAKSTHAILADISFRSQHSARAIWDRQVLRRIEHGFGVFGCGMESSLLIPARHQDSSVGFPVQVSDLAYGVKILVEMSTSKGSHSNFRCHNGIGFALPSLAVRPISICIVW